MFFLPSRKRRLIQDWEGSRHGDCGPPSGRLCTHRSSGRPSSPSRECWSSCLRSVCGSRAPSAAGKPGATAGMQEPSGQSPHHATHSQVLPGWHSVTHSNASTQKCHTLRHLKRLGWIRSPSVRRGQWPQRSPCWWCVWPSSDKRWIGFSQIWKGGRCSFSVTLSSHCSLLQSIQTYSQRS